MQLWLIYILIAMFFGSLTIVLAKVGLTFTTEYVSLFVRTTVLFLFTLIVTLNSGDIKKVMNLDRRSIVILTATGITTSIYWLFYYKALRSAQTYQVAAIDKAGIIVTVILSTVFLNESISLKSLLGIGLIVIGCLLVIVSN